MAHGTQIVLYKNHQQKITSVDTTISRSPKQYITRLSNLVNQVALTCPAKKTCLFY